MRIDTVFGGQPAVALPEFADTSDMFSILDGRRTPAGMVVTTGVRQGAELVIRSVSGPRVAEVRVDAATAAPRFLRTTGPGDSAQYTFTDAGVVRGWFVAPEAGVRRTVEGSNTDGVPVIGLGEVARFLPYRDGASFLVRAFETYLGGAVWKRLQVVGSDTATYRGATVETWVVEEQLDGLPPAMRHWISKQGHIRVKAVGLLPSPNGASWVFAR